MLGNHSPESAGIGGTDGFAFIDDGCCSLEQGAIDNIGVTDDPADIGGGPEHITRINVVEIFHGPVESNRVTSVISQNPFGHTGCPGGIEDVKGIGGFNRHAVSRRAACNQFVPVDVSSFGHIGGDEVSLQDDTFFRLMVGHVDGLINKRLIGKLFFAFNGTGGRDEYLRLGMINADGQFIGGKTSKNDGMNGTQPGTCQHGNGCLWNHWHIYNNSITFSDTK